MKAEVGFITNWRRAIFFTFIGCVVFFGIVSTICKTYLGAGLASNVISLFVLLICILLVILVLADKWNKFSGYGTAVIEDNTLIYNDKKRHFNIPLADIKKVDIEKIRTASENSMSALNSKVIAYRILIKTDRKKYYIESQRALGREYNEVDLYNLYLYIQRAVNK